MPTELAPTARRCSTGWPARCAGAPSRRRARRPRPATACSSASPRSGPRGTCSTSTTPTCPASRTSARRSPRRRSRSARRSGPPSATCSTPTRAASRRWARSPAPATPRSTTAAGIRPRSAAASARRSRAAALLDAPADTAAALAAVRASGLRAAFGSDGKSLQVGLAAASGVAAAQLAAAGAPVPLDRVAAAWRDAYGGEWAEPGDGPPAIDRNWIKAWPCCLQTHGAIECAERVGERARRRRSSCSPTRCRARRPATTTSRRRSQAKFSIPYTTAYTLLHGGPRVDAFGALDDARAGARGADRGPHRPGVRRVGVRAAGRRRGARAGRRGPWLARASALSR